MRFLHGLLKAMPKKVKSKPSATVTDANNIASPVRIDKSGNILVQVHAKPGAKKNGITSIDEDGIGVQIAARPVDGEANAQLLTYFSSVLNLKKSNISLDKGSKSRQKIIIITNTDLTTEDIIQKLKQEIE